MHRSVPSPRHLATLVRATVPPMHRAGRPFVVGSALATLLLRRTTRRAGTVGAIATAALGCFSREPHRVPPGRPGVAVAPADGTVSTVGAAPPPAELGLGTAPRPRVSVFLNIFDVHVQRIPIDGEVTRVAYRPGAFLSADLDKASDVNERNSLLLRGAGGHELAVVQIAGLVARRIVCTAREGDAVQAGRTYGLIRFGSRVDLYLPVGSDLLVRPGQRTIGGETVLATLPDSVGPGSVGPGSVGPGSVGPGSAG